MKLICMICSWRCFFGYKGKEGSFFYPKSISQWPTWPTQK
jgi:hypothetical protein